MATVLRLYIYLVCLISLQAVVVALNALLGGMVRLLLNTNAPDTFFFTFQLAVIIVGTPIFLAHWVWELYRVRKDQLELNALSRRLYLYTTKGIFVAYLAIAGTNSVQAFFTLLLARVLPVGVAAPEQIATLVNSLMAIAATGLLWFYHERLTASRALSHTSASRFLHQLYMLGFGGIGLSMAALGFASIQLWFFARLDGKIGPSLPAGIALLGVGAVLWLYHEWTRARDVRMKDAAGDTLRWLYATLFSAAGVIISLIGLSGCQVWLFHKLAGEPSPFLPDALAWLATGIPLLIYHELALRRVMDNRVKPLRWLYALLFSLAGMTGLITSLLVGLQWLFSLVSGIRAPIPDAAAGFVPSLLIWGYHQWVMLRMGDALGLAEQSGGDFRDSGRFLRRLYLYSFSAWGLALMTLGISGLLDWFFSLFSSDRFFKLQDALAWLLVGVPVWSFFWGWAGHLFRGPIPDERRSDLRKAYLYAVIYVAVSTLILSAYLLVNGALRSLLGLQVSGSLSLVLAVIVGSALVWAAHSMVLRGDIARAGESSLQAGMQRLYWYLLAGVGFAAFIIGLAGELSVVLHWLASGLRADAALEDQFAGFTAALAAGFPVWLMAWIPAQMAATRAGPVGMSSRRSVLRKIYLYFYSFVAVLMTLANAIAAVYQLLNALLGIFGGGNLFVDIAQSVGFTVIATLVWLYHGWVLRGDGQHAKLDQQLEADLRAQVVESANVQMRRNWAAFPVAVVDDGDGTFGRHTIQALKRELPYLTLVAIALTPQASAAMETSLANDVSAALATAQLIIAPWTAFVAGGAVAGAAAPKIVAPLKTPGMQWVGIGPRLDLGAQIIESVRQFLQATPTTPSSLPPPAPNSPPPASPPAGPKAAS